ncbi:MAG: hypothetical protein MUF54_22605 [Polyangiaceae bacterium]|nr:hypothetical protein [Polyangiaceae bacterium]
MFVSWCESSPGVATVRSWRGTAAPPHVDAERFKLTDKLGRGVVDGPGNARAYHSGIAVDDHLALEANRTSEPDLGAGSRLNLAVVGEYDLPQPPARARA